MSAPADPDNENRDPIDNFEMQLAIARMQADDKNFHAAYQTLVVAYEILIEQHEEAIEEVIRLRKKLHGI